MSTSGTLGQTPFTVDRVLSHAMQLAGVPSSRLTPENVLLMRESLYLLLLELTAMGINLWSMSQNLFGIYPGEIRVAMPTGTTDILNMSYRRTLRVEADSVTSSAGGTVANLSDSDVDTICTQAAANGNLVFDLGESPSPLTVLGFLPGATSTWTFTIAESDDNVTYTTLRTVTAQAVTDNRWLWYQLEPSVTKRYMRVLASGGTTLILRELYLCNTYSDIPIARLNMDDYSSLPYKQFPSQQPLQGWVDRKFDGVDLVLWPSPNTTFSCLWMFIYQETQDVGALTDSLAIPPRALPGVVKKLALDILLKIPEADKGRLEAIKNMSDGAIIIGRADERDRSPVILMPDNSAYTR